MRIRIVKALISWLVTNHYYLIYEAVVPAGKHVGWNPGKKPKQAKLMTEAQYKDEQDQMERNDEVGL